MSEPIWVLDSVILRIHDIQIVEHGGSSGIRDSNLLESALNATRQVFAYSEANIFELAAIYAERIVKNHPFIDGNKRTAFVTMVLFLHLNGYHLNAPDEECVLNIVKLASDQIELSSFTAWIEKNCHQVKS